MTLPNPPEPLVKVRILQSRRLSQEGEAHAVGEIVKVPESQAQAWIANGWAEAVPIKKQAKEKV